MLEDLTWTCHVCGDRRPDDRISVASRTLDVGGVEVQVNLRYCNDRPACVEGVERKLDEQEERLAPPASCPRCHSPSPHLHPAVQHEGEVQPCSHVFHLRETTQNTPERIAESQGILERTS